MYTLYAILYSSVSATCPAHLILLELINLKYLLSTNHKASQHAFILQPAVTSLTIR